MPLPILPILMAMPAAAKIIHALFAERPADNTQKVLELLELAEGRLATMQARLTDAEKKLAECEAKKR